jgi:haloalkane dehalogenase
MDLLRTPDERFAELPGWPCEPQYQTVDGVRMHYVDEGPADADPVLCLHGEPSWGYLYRHIIPPLAAAGHRVVVPDLVGFGRSDKPARREDHSYARHVAWMRGLVEALDLRSVTLVCQDWGGLIGLRVLAEQPDRFARVVAANTGLPTGDHRTSDAFAAWQRWSLEAAEFPVGTLLQGGTTSTLEGAVLAAYDAPFPDESYKEGPRAMPGLVPTAPDNQASAANRAAWEVLQRFDRPFLTAFSDRDPLTAGAERVFQKLVPGAQGLEHPTVRGAGHFLQEDAGEELARIAVEFIAAT